MKRFLFVMLGLFLTVSLLSTGALAGEKPAGGPHCFQDGNGLFLFFEKSRQGALDTDAGQQQRESPD